jgi:hypothetical protein
MTLARARVSSISVRKRRSQNQDGFVLHGELLGCGGSGAMPSCRVDGHGVLRVVHKTCQVLLRGSVLLAAEHGE